MGCVGVCVEGMLVESGGGGEPRDRTSPSRGFFFLPLVTPFCPMDVTFSSCSFLSQSFCGEASLGRWEERVFFSHEPSELQFTNYSVN